MSDEVAVVPADSARHVELAAAGWVVTARSWPAQLAGNRIDRALLHDLGARGPGQVRELCAGDVDRMLALDAETSDDYPGGVATRHEPLDRARATLSPRRRGFGAFHGGVLIGMTVVDCAGAAAETDFTVVARPWRGRGVGTGLKAASILALADQGIATFRTGGSAENPTIMAANSKLGYVIDEEWVTLTPATRSP